MERQQDFQSEEWKGDDSFLKQHLSREIGIAVNHLSSFVRSLKKRNRAKPLKLAKSSSDVKMCFEECLQSVHSSLHDIENEITKQISKQGDIKTDIGRKENEISCLTDSIIKQKKRIEEVNAKLKVCNDGIKTANESIKIYEAEEKATMDSCNSARTAFVITAFLPGINILAAPISYGFWKHYENVLDDVKFKKSIALSNSEECRKALTSLTAFLKRSQDDIMKMEREKRALQQEIEKMKPQIDALRQKQQNTVNMDHELKSICKIATDFYSRATVLHEETKDGYTKYSVQPLMCPLKELIEKLLALAVANFCPLTDKDLKLLNKLQRKVEKIEKRIVQTSRPNSNRLMNFFSRLR